MISRTRTLLVQTISVVTVLTLPVSSLQAQSSSTTASRITPSDPPNRGLLFINHATTNRSGHLRHALVEYEAGKILAFYPNCSDDHDGHSAVGWMEFKRSVDGGLRAYLWY